MDGETDVPPLAFAWIVPRRLAVAPRPDGAASFASLRGEGVRALVGLGGRPLPFDLLSRYGFQTEHIPVPSAVAPAPAQIERAVAAIRWYLAAGMPVAVHDGPGPGPGHAGPVVAGYLVAEGAPPAEAVEALGAACPGALEGEAQLAAVSAYALRLRPPPGPGGPEQRRSAPPGATTSEAALRQLLEGNRRYVAERMEHPRQGASRREALAIEQYPFAAVLGCADSRVPVEIVFDAGLGDLFVVRSAGPVLDGGILGSLEYAVKERRVPLLLVLVHERCGAVGAAVATARGAFRPEGRVEHITTAIAPAVKAAAGQPGDPLENALRAHAARLVADLRQAEPILAPAVAEGRLRVVGARYDLESGLVEVIVP
jgi:carbonic anhydrase